MRGYFPVTIVTQLHHFLLYYIIRIWTRSKPTFYMYCTVAVSLVTVMWHDLQSMSHTGKGRWLQHSIFTSVRFYYAQHLHIYLKEVVSKCSFVSESTLVLLNNRVSFIGFSMPQRGLRSCSVHYTPVLIILEWPPQGLAQYSKISITQGRYVHRFTGLNYKPVSSSEVVSDIVILVSIMWVNIWELIKKGL